MISISELYTQRKFPSKISDHSKFIRELFPDINSFGIDLPALDKKGKSIEIKECTIYKQSKKGKEYNKYDYKILLKNSDTDSDYILTFFWVNMTFYLIKTSDFIEVHDFKFTSIRHYNILKNCIIKWKIFKNKDNRVILLDLLTYINSIRLYGDVGIE